MTDVRELVLDLRTHALDAPAHCRALMRRAANLLEASAVTITSDCKFELVIPDSFHSQEQADAQG